ncbi:MAG: glycosyltransferase [Bacteroidales bacterium]|nr:glycosyltransferase [Bacteroidales bacterium]
MISVCIPVYNVNIQNLISCFVLQVQKLEIPCELIIADDCSHSWINNLNRKHAEQFGVRYFSLPENIGRSAIRNFLTHKAQYSNLLFVDCDSGIINENYLKMYIPYCGKNLVVYGGRVYQSQKPDKQFRLHWNYGRLRESRPLKERELYPTRFFQTNNFLIERNILLKFPFDENIKHYGHEDTLLAVKLFQNDIKVVHIENPVLHEGLERDSDFISKAESAIRNLIIIDQLIPEVDVLTQHINLYKAFLTIRKLKLVALMNFGWKLTRQILLFLIREYYLLKVLDIYKLGLLCNEYKKSTVRANDAFQK